MDRLALVNALLLSHRGFGEEADRVERLQLETDGRALTSEQTRALLESHLRMALLNQNATLSMICYLTALPPGCERRITPKPWPT